jgi:hypothetical protein
MPSIFRGWIPTVAGALSYGTFGEASHPPRAVAANRSDRSTRYLVCYRARDCSDGLLPFRAILGPRLLGLQGKLWFDCIAESTTVRIGDQDKINGHIFLFNDRREWTTNILPALQAAQTRLKAYQSAVDGALQKYFQQTFSDLNDDLPSMSAFNAKFCVSRTGISEIHLDDNMTVNMNAPRIPSTQPRRDHIRHILAAQIFFFLRDIGHRHQHHDPNTDTIVDLWPDNPNDPFEWKLQTLYSLYRKVISYKRLRERGSFASSIGVIAYADTFRAIIERDASSPEVARLPPFYSAHVVSSIRARDEDMRRMERRRQDASTVTRDLLLASLGLTIAITTVFIVAGKTIEVTPAPILYFIAEMLAARPIETLLAIAGVVLTIRAVANDVGRQKIVRWIFRLLQPLKLFVTITIFGLLTVLIFVLLFYLIIF